MELGKKYIKKLPAGVEDLLLDATAPSTVIQIRGGREVEITKINIDTIPAAGKYGEQGFQSLREYIQTLISNTEGLTDELVKINSSDPNSGYLYDKVDTTQFEIANYRIKIKDDVLKIAALKDVHIESLEDGYVLYWDEALNKYAHKPITLDGLTSEDFVKTNQSDPQTITNGAPLLDFDITASSNVLSLVNKKYVDFITATSGTLRYYLSGETNGYGANIAYLNTPQSQNYEFNFSYISDGDLLLTFETDSLNIDKLYAGVLNLIMDVQKTSGSRDLRLYWVLKGRDSNGNLSSTLLTSDDSDQISDSLNIENIPAVITDDIDISGYNSLVVEVYAKVIGFGSSPSVKIIVGNNSNTVLSIPIPAEGLTNLYALKTLENVLNSDFLNKILNVDGDGSGIDADMVDGKHASDFEPAGAVANHETAYDHSKLNVIKTDGSGDSFLADDGVYKSISSNVVIDINEMHWTLDNNPTPVNGNVVGFSTGAEGKGVSVICYVVTNDNLIGAQNPIGIFYDNKIYISGVVSGVWTNLIPLNYYYIGADGTITPQPPENDGTPRVKRVVGIALNKTDLLVIPNGYMEVINA